MLPSRSGDNIAYLRPMASAVGSQSVGKIAIEAERSNFNWDLKSADSVTPVEVQWPLGYWATPFSGLENSSSTRKLNFEASGSLFLVSERIQQFEYRISTAIADLGASIERINRKIDNSEGSLDRIVNLPDLFLSRQELEDVLGKDLSGSQWVDLFNEMADLELRGGADLRMAAAEALSSESGPLRSAAGRALGVCWRDLAIEVLPAAIEAEVDKFVLATLRGALRAAKL